MSWGSPGQWGRWIAGSPTGVDPGQWGRHDRSYENPAPKSRKPAGEWTFNALAADFENRRTRSFVVRETVGSQLPQKPAPCVGPASGDPAVLNGARLACPVRGGRIRIHSSGRGAGPSGCITLPTSGVPANLRKMGSFNRILLPENRRRWRMAVVRKPSLPVPRGHFSRYGSPAEKFLWESLGARDPALSCGFRSVRIRSCPGHKKRSRSPFQFPGKGR